MKFTATMHEEATVTSLLKERIVKTPNEPAYFVETSPSQWASISWSEFGIKVAKLAAVLKDGGLSVGDRVAIMMNSNLEWETLNYAVLSLGASVVGIDMQESVERVFSILETSQAKLLVVESSELSQLLKDSKSTNATLVTYTDLALLTPLSTAKWIALDANPDDEATVIFTSGSTGTPKC